jgi:hypothetical protein
MKQIKVLYLIIAIFLVYSACQTEQKNSNVPCVQSEISIENINQGSSKECQISGLWKGKIDDIERSGIVSMSIFGDSLIQVTLVDSNSVQNTRLELDFSYCLLPNVTMDSVLFLRTKTWKEGDFNAKVTAYTNQLEKHNNLPDCFYYDKQKQEISAIILKKEFNINPAFKNSKTKIGIEYIKVKASTKPLKQPCIHCG